MLNLPKHYKLGNMIFGDYEQDAHDCGLRTNDVIKGKRCPLAYMETPFKKVIPHPEFSRFDINNSVALVQLLRPMKSDYVLPACLPTIQERARKKVHNTVFLIDYISGVPRDFDFEKIGKKTLKLYYDRRCKINKNKQVFEKNTMSQFLCTTGCGMRPGAPIISHTMEGRFELIGLAIGNSRCADRSMRNVFNENPPLYLDVYPYASWIINVVYAHMIPKPYPVRLSLLDGGLRSSRKSKRGLKKESGWKGRTYLIGAPCFANRKVRRESSFFYMEWFEVNADTRDKPTGLNITIEISSGIECVYACIRIVLPHREIKPVTKVDGMLFTLNMRILTFDKRFSFSMGISGKNATRDEYMKRKEKKAVQLL